MKGAPVGWIAGYPAPVLQLAPDGIILASNGRAEADLGREVIGLPVDALLDAPSSGAKWARMLERARAAPVEGWELVLCAGDVPLEPRRFTLVPDDVGDHLWLVGQPADPRVDEIRAAVVEV